MKRKQAAFTYNLLCASHLLHCLFNLPSKFSSFLVFLRNTEFILQMREPSGKSWNLNPGLVECEVYKSKIFSPHVVALRK